MGRRLIRRWASQSELKAYVDETTGGQESVAKSANNFHRLSLVFLHLRVRRCVRHTITLPALPKMALLLVDLDKGNNTRWHRFIVSLATNLADQRTTSQKGFHDGSGTLAQRKLSRTRDSSDGSC